MSWGRDTDYTIVEPTYSYSYSVSPFGPVARRRGRFFSRTEIKHIVIAVSVLIAAFTMIMRNWGSTTLLEAFGIASLSVVLGFFLHEMAHKVMAKKYGCWAEFRAYYGGLLLALAMSFFGFLFAAPGAVYIAGNITKEQSGKISLAGPATNIAVALACLPIIFVGSSMEVVGDIARALLFFNTFLAAFNLLPIPPLDGSKVWAWNKPLYIASMAAAASLFLFFA